MNNTFDEFDRYDTVKKSRLPFKKRWIFLGLFLIIIISIAVFIIRLIPNKDHISTKDVAQTYFIDNKDNFYDLQFRGDCSGYASAYVMRHFGIDAHGAQVYDTIHKTLGEYPTPTDIAKKFAEYNLTAQGYRGNLDTLKAELNKGVPVIALVHTMRNQQGKLEGLHYVVVVGYDEEYLYIADSCRVNMNVYAEDTYNRKITYKEFEEFWNTKSSILVSNVYIVVTK